MPPQLSSEKTRQVPQGGASAPPSDLPDKGGQNLCGPTKGVSKSTGTGRKKNAWILEATWRLVDDRVSARQDPVKYQALIWRLGCNIVESLKVDRRWRAEEAGKEVETLLGLYPPSPPPGILAPVKGVISGCVQSYFASCSFNPRADHGGAGGTLQLRPAPGGKYHHFRGAIPG